MQKLIPGFARLTFVFGFISAGLVMAQTAPQDSHRFAPGSCGPVDPSYIRVAEDTGGIPFFFERSEVAQSTKFMRASSGENHVSLLWAKGQGKNTQFLVPVDPSLEQVMFAFSTARQDSKMEVSGPNEAPVADGPSTEVTDFTCGRLIAVKKPVPGRYRVSIESAGQYWVSVVGKSSIFLSRVEFVELGGRPGHQGMFPIHGQPLVGKPANLEASGAGAVKSIAFALVTPEDRTIRLLDLTPIENQDGEYDFAGQISLPSEPFRVVATGIDPNGMPFRRTHERLFRPTTISLLLMTPRKDALPAGVSSALTFEVKNLGNPDTLSLRAICSSGWPTELDRTVVSLAHGETAKVVVTVSVPEETSAYRSGKLVLTASSQNDPSISNSVVHPLAIESQK